MALFSREWRKRHIVFFARRELLVELRFDLGQVICPGTYLLKLVH